MSKRINAVLGHLLAARTEAETFKNKKDRRRVTWAIDSALAELVLATKPWGRKSKKRKGKDKKR